MARCKPFHHLWDYRRQERKGNAKKGTLKIWNVSVCEICGAKKKKRI